MAITPLYTVDSNGQMWSLVVNPDGSVTTTPVASGTVSTAPPTGDNYTTTLQEVVNVASTHVDLMPLASVGGYTQEPALSLANDTLQELLSSPYDWKFNGKPTDNPFVTQPGRQDYLFGGATAFVVGFGGVSIGLATGNGVVQTAGSSVVTVRTMQPHNFSVGQTVYMLGNTNATYNSTRIETTTATGWSGGWAITAIIDAFTFTFDIGLTVPSTVVTGAAGIFDYSWLEHARMYDISVTDPVPYEWEVEAVKSLRKDGQIGRPRKIAVLSQLNGVLTIRLSHVPQSPSYAVTPHYQMSAPLKTDLSQNWYPFPDEFGFVYRQAFLARCYRFLDKARADSEEQKSQAMIAKALGKDDVEESNQFVTPERSLMGDDFLW